MLHRKGRKGCEKNIYKITVSSSLWLFFSLIFLILSLTSCSINNDRENNTLSFSSFQSLFTEEYAIDADEFKSFLAHLVDVDKSSSSPDKFLKKYYSGDNPYIWVSHSGLTSNADSLLSFLAILDTLGLSQDAFRLSQIREDVDRFRNLDFNEDKSTIEKVVARLEYNLSKALLRYAKGQRYGFTAPAHYLNRLDKIFVDSVNFSYRRLFDIDNSSPKDSFFIQVLNTVNTDSMIVCLRNMSPNSDIYCRLYDEMKRATSHSYRRLLAVNMEKCRWFRGRTTDEVNKHIVVNIPSLTLYAYADDSTLTMRVACGSMLTKSPILQSRIYRMDVNPQWVIPQSIVKKDIARHAGNTSYFARHRYNICKRPSFRKVNISSVSYQMLMSGKYAVVQEGGEGNSLGRIIFRFMNNFSVYLHDTSSRGVFSREDRRVSHGCIRVQHPYELARFLLGSEDIDLLDKIEYSMTANMRPVMVDSVMVSPDIDKSRLVHSAKVNPKIPIAITYYTVYPDKAGNLIVYDDVYGYDSIIEEHLSGYLQ